MKATRWIVDKIKRGTHIVRARETREVIGGIIPFRKAGKDVAYMATRAEGGARDFNTRFEACAWLMDGFDAKQEEGAAQAAPTPRYRWDSPGEWLAEKINNFEAATGFAELRSIALALLSNVDSDTVQDTFQDEMDNAGYFVDLDKPVYVLYEMEPIGSAGTLEANGTVHYFCSEKCRRIFETDAEVSAGETTVGAPEVEYGTVCDECGKQVAAQ